MPLYIIEPDLKRLFRVWMVLLIVLLQNIWSAMVLMKCPAFLVLVKRKNVARLPRLGNSVAFLIQPESKALTVLSQLSSHRQQLPSNVFVFDRIASVH